MKRIGFVAHGPASANSLLPIIKELKDRVEIRLFAYHPYVANLWGCEQIRNTVYPEEFREVDVVIYGTGSAGHEIELNVPLEARKWGIPSVSILDCYWADEDNLYKRFKNKPTYLIVPNEESKDKVRKLSLLKEEHILVLGNPHFDRLKEFREQTKVPKYPLNVVFFSQCKDTSDYSDTHATTKEALESLVAYRNTFQDKLKHIVVAPHPREDRAWLNNFSEVNHLEIQENKSTELMLETDISVGMSCTLQYEAEIIGKPTIFYQSKEHLWEQLDDIKAVRNAPIKDFKATEKCVLFIKQLLAK